MKYLLILLGVVGLLFVIVVVTGLLLPKNHTATRSLTLHQSPQAVYDLISGAPTWRPSIHTYEPVGSINGKPTWREIDQHNSAITFEEEEATPPTRRVTRIADKNLPFGGTWTYEIQPTSSGSILRITEHGEVYNPIFRFASRFVMGHTATIDQYLKDVAAHFNEAANLQG